MSDRDDIQQNISTYSAAGSIRDWYLLVSTFMPDATWDLAGTEYKMKGQAQMRAEFPRFVDATEYLVQTNAPALIKIDGDTATARSMIREAGKVKDKEEWMEIVGIYDDRLSRTAQGWRFSHRTFTLIGLARTPMLPNTAIPRDS